MAKKTWFAVITPEEHQDVHNKTWDQIQPMVSGVSGANYKGFYAEDAAREWFEEHKPVEVERGGLVAYVDGSNTGSGSAASWAYLIGKETADERLYEILECGSGRTREGHLGLTALQYEEALKQRNIFGELVAAGLAAKAAAQFLHEGQRLTLLHDYIGIARYATGAWPKRKTALAQRYFLEMQYHVDDIDFVHVKGHTGVEGNEVADDLAGFALGRGGRLPAVTAV